MQPLPDRSPLEHSIDMLVGLTATLFRVPTTFISLIKADVVWFKYTRGWVGSNRLPLEETLCSLTVQQSLPTCFPDLRLEPCEQLNTNSIDALNIRFYLGFPLRTSKDIIVGVLAIVDNEPHQPTSAEFSLLQDLAELASVLFELKRTRPTLTTLARKKDAQHTITQTMSRMHTLATRRDLNMFAGLGNGNLYSTIGQEAHELATYIRSNYLLSRY